jgi:putative tricarboxylic transport membrane protein
MSRIKNLNDVLSGVLLIVVACLGLYLSWRLNSGTSAAMGPGYVPKMLSFIQIAFGIALIAIGTMTEGEAFEAWFPRPLFWVLLSVAFFGVTIERFGLVVAVVGLVLLSCVANKGTKPLEAGLLGVGMAAFAVLTFVTALGLPILVWPTLLVR